MFARAFLDWKVTCVIGANFVEKLGDQSLFFLSFYRMIGSLWVQACYEAVKKWDSILGSSSRSAMLIRGHNP